MNFIKFSKAVLQKLYSQMDMERDMNERSINHSDKPLYPVVQLKRENLIGKISPETLIQDDWGIDEYSEAKLYEEIGTYGFEAIASYAPIHFYGKEGWGIYVNHPAFKRFVKEICSKTNDNSMKARKKCLDVVLAHEYFHFDVELFCLMAEGVVPMNIYEVYKHTVDHEIEEALANRQSLKSRPLKKLFREALSEIYRKCPNGYAKFGDYLKKKQFDIGISILKSKIFGNAPVDHEATVFFTNEDFSKKLYSQIPVYPYSPPRFQNTCIFFSFLANVRPKEFIHYLKDRYKANFYDSGGKHAKIIFPNGKVIPLSRHSELKDYLLKEVAAMAGISKTDVINDFRNY